MTDRKKLVKKLDTVFSEYIRLRDNYKCVTCGKTKESGAVIQCGHLFSRVTHSTRWDVKNAFAQCSGCNRYHEECSEPLRQAFLKKYNEKEYDKLYAKFSKPTKFSNGDLEAMIKYFKGEIKK